MGAACSQPSLSMAFSSSGERPTSADRFGVIQWSRRPDTLIQLTARERDNSFAFHFLFAPSSSHRLKALAMKSSLKLSRRSFLKSAALTTLAAPYFIPRLRGAPPPGRVWHAGFGASGRAGADLSEITSHKNAVLV